MKLSGYSVFFLTVFLIFSCKGNLSPSQSFGKDGSLSEEELPAGSGNLTFCCWNAQTFFDAVCDGTEYTDFQRSEKWTKDKYSKRLDSLCEVMTTINPDIMVLEEIENEAVVQDISNRLTSGAWDKNKGWQYACFAKANGTAIGCAVFSRLELSSLKVHALTINVHEESQPSERPLMEVCVHAGDKDFKLFVCHWKSKTGGAAETEIWRDWQESLLAGQLYKCRDSGKSAVICGDFNRSAEDFIVLPRKKDGANIMLRGTDEKSVNVYCPWISADGRVKKDSGSYVYNDTWERIDNIFSFGDIKISRFQTVTIPPVADEDGKPIPYKMYTETGYSDHLPLKCVLTL